MFLIFEVTFNVKSHFWSLILLLSLDSFFSEVNFLSWSYFLSEVTLMSASIIKVDSLIHLFISELAFALKSFSIYKLLFIRLLNLVYSWSHFWSLKSYFMLWVTFDLWNHLFLKLVFISEVIFLSEVTFLIGVHYYRSRFFSSTNVLLLSGFFLYLWSWFLSLKYYWYLKCILISESSFAVWDFYLWNVVISEFTFVLWSET